MVYKVYDKNVFFLVTKHPVYLQNLGLDAKFKYVQNILYFRINYFFLKKPFFSGNSVQVRKILQKPKKFE